jgi:hypothetical protein
VSDDMVWVGKCPKHGIVTGDEVDAEFPTTANCECSRQLDSARLITEMRLKELTA